MWGGWTSTEKAFIVTPAIYKTEVMIMADLDDLNEVAVTGIEEAEEAPTPRASNKIGPEEFFAKHAFRVVYQTNNFLLP
jgi:hypothetical protein